MKGRFITFEGCEGVGKSTQVRMLIEYLKDKNVPFEYIREPGGTKISEQIRQILLNIENKEMHIMTETLLYCAARVQVLNEKIIPAIESGKLVVCDRFVDSTMAYQGYARKIGIDNIVRLHEIACNGYLPDCTIFLNMNPKDAFMRKGGAEAEDRLEQEGIAFHENVYKGYIEVANRFQDRIVVIDNSKYSKYETQEKIRNELRKRGIIE